MKIWFFQTSRGQAPVQEYIDALETRDAVKIYDALQDIRENGLRGALVSVRQIRGKLWEIKVSAHRVFYAALINGSLVLLHAYRKQGQKAPKVEIETALQRLRKLLEQEEQDDAGSQEKGGPTRARRR